MEEKEPVQATPAPPQTFMQKYQGAIIIILLLAIGAGVLITLNKSQSSNTPTLVRRDTVTALYILFPNGGLSGGTVLQDHLSDKSIVYEVPNGVDTAYDASHHPLLDTLRTADGRIRWTDSVKHIALTSTRIVPHLNYLLPKYVWVTPIPAH